MGRILRVILLTLSPVLVLAQTPVRRAETEAVKNAAGTIAGLRKPKAEVVLRDLREFEGTITGIYNDHFVLVPKEKGGKLSVTIIVIGRPPSRPGVNIKYSDVLQMEGKGTAVSFVPDPKSSPYGEWGEVAEIGRGEFVQVHRSNGSATQGVLFIVSDDDISLMRGNRVLTIPVAEVSKVYRVVGDTRGLAKKILTGGTRGREISEKIFPILDPAARANPLANVIGAAVGVTIFLLPIGKTARVLVFSR